MNKFGLGRSSKAVKSSSRGSDGGHKTGSSAENDLEGHGEPSSKRKNPAENLEQLLDQSNDEVHKLRMHLQDMGNRLTYQNSMLSAYMNKSGYKWNRNKPEAAEILEFCNSVLKSEDNARRKKQEMQDKLEKKTTDLKHAEQQIKGLISDFREERRIASEFNSKYLDAKARLLKSERTKQETIIKLTNQLDEAKAQHELILDRSLHHLKMQLSALENDKMRINDEHHKQTEDLRKSHDMALVLAAEQHARELNERTKQKDQEIDNVIDAYEVECNILKNKVRELATDLISQTDDFRPATDEGLRIKMLNLRNRIKNITIPNNLFLQSYVSPANDDALPMFTIYDAVNGMAASLLPPSLTANLSDFMARHTFRDLQYLIRGLVWAVLTEAFFAAPFGFGFLGKGGMEKLLDIHRAWHRSYSKQAASRNEDELAVYHRDLNANKLRSAVFQSFLPVVFREKTLQRHDISMEQNQHKKGPGPQEPPLTLQLRPPPEPAEDLSEHHATSITEEFSTHHPKPSEQERDEIPSLINMPNSYPEGQDSVPQQTHRLPQPPISLPQPTSPPPASWQYWQNQPQQALLDTDVGTLYKQQCDTVFRTLRDMLGRITGQTTRPEVFDMLSDIVFLAAELSIECGVQRTQILMMAPQRLATVQIGAEYLSCVNGDVDKDKVVTVDWVVSPGLVRIGDGQASMTVRKALVPCEIYPL